jgi:chemotaxis protein methyltransferase CheR
MVWPVQKQDQGAIMLVEKDREFELTDRDYEFLRDLVGKQTGIVLGGHKRQLVYGRLARRLRELGLATFAQYCNYVQQNHESELTELVNAITTNLTSFFRENHHFEHLADAALTDILARNASRRRLRIWSAGCSTGEEPYSIAMTLAETIPDIARWDVRVLATDIDSQVLAKAASGVYPEDRVKDIAPQRMRRWFRRGSGPRAGQVKITEEIQSLISFRQLNLMEQWPMQGPFDIIFCRNVVIYFDKETQKKLFNRYADILVPEGYLYVGHSESLFKTCDRFRLIGRTIYQKC